MESEAYWIAGFISMLGLQLAEGNLENIVWGILFLINIVGAYTK